MIMRQSEAIVHLLHVCQICDSKEVHYWQKFVGYFGSCTKLMRAIQELGIISLYTSTMSFQFYIVHWYSITITYDGMNIYYK